MTEAALAQRLWKALGGAAGAPGNISFEGRSEGVPSTFHVGTLASATIGVAALAVAELMSVRRSEPLKPVRVDRRLAGAVFRCERLFVPQGWKVRDAWDPIAGDYRAKNGWIRLHTNYVHHRAAAARVLGVPEERNAVAEAVAKRDAHELESAIVAAGGAAAAMRTIEAWQAHPQGRALADEPLVAWHGSLENRAIAGKDDAPLAGIRVLDLTRVIAGPVGTRFLAGYGAQVLRIDPPGFEEHTNLLPEGTLGKRCAALDLKSADGKRTFLSLVRDAQVLVHGYRPGAMEALGLDEESLRKANAALVIIRHDAYGWSGPWAGRRGFDSLVQMSTGIAHPGHDGTPTPLPAQALDHGTGHLIAAVACRAISSDRASARLSLARTAKLLVDLGRTDPRREEAMNKDELLQKDETGWGPILRVRHAERIEGCTPRWTPAGPIGRHEARWL
jgi:hypothetical protein